MSIVAHTRPFVIGVDAHARTHALAVLACPTGVTCQRDGTTVLPRAWDHLEVLLSIVSSGGGVNADAPALAV